MNITVESISLLAFRRLFYLVRPSEAMYESLQLVPNYVVEAFPYFFLMILVEGIIISWKRKKYTSIDVSDSISSMSAGIISQLPLLFSKSTEVVAYIWVSDHYRLMDLPSDSIIVWFLGLLGVDFGYYWVHRASHEMSLFWSGHQVHHSSQRYNLTTALRQGSLQRYFSWMFYLPLALVLPKTVFVVHIQFNLLYQFWIHTEVIGKLGLFEYVLNTPSHHRVHHGRNKYCIDKNYGGTLIVFDRIFGTFEKENDEVVYGLVHTLQSWNPFEVQVCHLRYVVKSFWRTEGIVNRLKVLFYGPGWTVGSVRLGDEDQIPDPEHPVRFYQKDVDVRVFTYCLINFILANVTYWLLAAFINKLTYETLLFATWVIIGTLVQIGRMLDGNSVFWSECIRISIIIAGSSRVLLNLSQST